MPEDLREYRERTARQNAAVRVEEAARRLQTVHQAGVKTALLTGDPNWDFFLTYLQAGVDGMKAQAADLERIILDPHVVDPLILQQSKNMLADLNGRSGALEAVISLPKELIDRGREAKSILERMEETNATSSG